MLFFSGEFGFASIPISKGIAFITGAMFALAVNRLWTFQSKNKIQGDVVRFASIYSLALLLNISMNSLLLDKLKFVENIFIVAFFVSTFLSATFNFLGMNFGSSEKECRHDGQATLFIDNSLLQWRGKG